MRGLARSKDRYYELLADADSSRRGDLDGRGNLSEQALIAWVDYFLDDCLDQVQYMAQMLDLGAMADRILACLLFESANSKAMRKEAQRPLHYLFLSGAEMTRGDFKSMLGLGGRVATEALSALIRRGLLVSDTPQGKVRVGLPQHSLRFLFPALWPEAERDVPEKAG